MKIIRWDKCKDCPFIRILTYPVMFVCPKKEKKIQDYESIPEWCDEEDDVIPEEIGSKLRQKLRFFNKKV